MLGSFGAPWLLRRDPTCAWTDRGLALGALALSPERPPGLDEPWTDGGRRLVHSRSGAAYARLSYDPASSDALACSGSGQLRWQIRVRCMDGPEEQSPAARDEDEQHRDAGTVSGAGLSDGAEVLARP